MAAHDLRDARSQFRAAECFSTAAARTYYLPRIVTERRYEIAEVLRRRVLRGLHAGTLQRGDRLPSARELEEEFDADVRLILDAYRELVAEGLVELRPRGGIYVAAEPAAGEQRLVPTPAEGWIVDVLVQGISREVPLVELGDWMHHAVGTLRLRAAAIASTPDQVAGLCRELHDDYGLEAAGVLVADLPAVPDAHEPAGDGGDDDGALPAAVRRADLLLTTAANGALVRRLAERLGKQCIVAAIRPDLIEGEWRLLLKRPVYVVVRDERFLALLHRFFADTPGAENLRPLVIGRDDLGAIPEGAPTYVTRSAAESLGDTVIRGQILPAARLFSAETVREIVTFVVRANLGAFTQRPRR